MRSHPAKFRLHSLTISPTGTGLGLWFRRLRHALLAVFLTALLLSTGFADFRPTTIDLAVAPYRYSLLNWELGHLPDKWFRKLRGALPGRYDLTREEKIAQVKEFFDLGLEVKHLEQELLFPEAARAAPGLSASKASAAPGEIDRDRTRRRSLQTQVEATIEAQVSAVLVDAGLVSPLGAVFPPVDAVFTSSPNVLVVSPRDRIDRQQTILLGPGMDIEAKEAIEERVLREENLSALVESTGGVAVYPSVVSDTFGLQYAVETTAHEWLHHWFFFRPLGRNFWRSPEMTTLNETAATIGGEELGDLAYTALTGEPVRRKPPSAPAPDPSGFDFNAEMRQTRLRTEELLAQGKIEEAEAYMEERRKAFVANGYLIRKINQAYFAFHGSYATGAASASPIGDQLRELRSRSDSLGGFLKTVAGFGSYQDFLDYLVHTRDGQ